MDATDQRVAVELMRERPAGTECIMVFMDDSPDLRCGELYRNERDGSEWRVYSVHRCQQQADGTTDHSECWH